jgi:arsenical pump membrane protein
VPPLSAWFASFALPSAVSIVATYAVLRLTAGGWTALAGIVCTAIGLLLVSWVDKPPGLPTGMVDALANVLRSGIECSLPGAAAAASAVVAFGSNIINNQPAGLIANSIILQAKPPQVVIDALLIEWIFLARTSPSPAPWQRFFGSPRCAGTVRTSPSGVSSKSAAW